MAPRETNRRRPGGRALSPNALQPVPAAFLRDPVHMLALGFGAGLAPRMPGTAGSLVGVLLYIPMQDLPATTYAVVVLMLFLAGIPICGRTARDLRVHDHPAIVWDELVGMLAAMAAAPRGWIGIAAGFTLFRLFDIAKPWPIRLLDARVMGGMGIMLDDLAAAAFSGALLKIIAYILSS